MAAVRAEGTSSVTCPDCGQVFGFDASSLCLTVRRSSSGRFQLEHVAEHDIKCPRCSELLHLSLTGYETAEGEFGDVSTKFSGISNPRLATAIRLIRAD